MLLGTYLPNLAGRSEQLAVMTLIYCIQCLQADMKSSFWCMFSSSEPCSNSLTREHDAAIEHSANIPYILFLYVACHTPQSSLDAPSRRLSAFSLIMWHPLSSSMSHLHPSPPCPRAYSYTRFPHTSAPIDFATNLPYLAVNLAGSSARDPDAPPPARHVPTIGTARLSIFIYSP